MGIHVIIGHVLFARLFENIGLLFGGLARVDLHVERLDVHRQAVVYGSDQGYAFLDPGLILPVDLLVCGPYQSGLGNKKHLPKAAEVAEKASEVVPEVVENAADIAEAAL